MKKKAGITFVVLSILLAGTFFLFHKTGYKLAKRAYQPSSSLATGKAAAPPSTKGAAAEKDQTTAAEEERKKADPRSDNLKENNRALASSPPAREKIWKKALAKTLARQLKAWSAKPEIKSLGGSKIKEGRSTQDVEHVLISIDKGQGNVSSYEAYVHPKTGRILKTWNQTRFENREPLALKAKPFRPFP